MDGDFNMIPNNNIGYSTSATEPHPNIWSCWILVSDTFSVIFQLYNDMQALVKTRSVVYTFYTSVTYYHVSIIQQFIIEKSISGKHFST